MYSLRSRKQNPDYCVGNSPEKRKFKRKSVPRAKHKDDTSDDDSENSRQSDILKTEISGTDENIPQSCSKTKLKCPKSVPQTKNKSEVVDGKTGNNVTQSNDQNRKLRSKSVSKSDSKCEKEIDNEDTKVDEPDNKEIIENVNISTFLNQIEAPNTKQTVGKNVEDSDNSESSNEVETLSNVDDREAVKSNDEGDDVSRINSGSIFQVETVDESKSSSHVETGSDIADMEDVNSGEDSVSQINSTFQIETIDKTVEDDSDDRKSNKKDVSLNVSQSKSQFHDREAVKSNDEGDDVSRIDIGSMFQVETVDENKSSSHVETGSDINDTEDVNSGEDSVSQINSTFQVETIDETIEDDSDDSNKKDVSLNVSESRSQIHVENVDTEGNNYRKAKQEIGYISQINSSFKVETVNDKNDNEGTVEDDILFEIDTVGKKDEEEEEDIIIKTVDSESDEEDDRNNLSQVNSLFQMDIVSEKDEDSEVETDEHDSDDEVGEDDEEEDDEEDEDGHTNQPIFKFPLNRSRDEIMKYSTGSSKKGFFNCEDTYLDIQLDTRKGVVVNRDARKFSRVDEVMKKSTITPGFEKLHAVPAYDESDRILKKQRMKERERTKGSKWFNMPATEMTEEMKHDLEVIQMRSVLDPKHFYKKNDLKVLPKYFQVGKVENNAADFYNSRLPKKQRKRTIVEELLADSDFKRYNKKRYTEIIEERRKTHFKAHSHAKKLKKRKK